MNINSNKIIEIEKNLSDFPKGELLNTTDLDIEGNCLYHYDGDKKNIILPSGITKIAELAFDGYKNLESIVISQGVTHLGENSFSDCENLQSVFFTKFLV